MAVTSTILGRVDIPQYGVGQPGQPTDLSAWFVRITYASGDYSTGVSLATVTAALGISQVVGCYVTCAFNASTAIAASGFYDRIANKLRLLTALTTTGTDYTPGATGDTVDMMVIGI